MLCEYSYFIECYRATKDHVDLVLTIAGEGGEGWCVCVCVCVCRKHKAFKTRQGTINAYGIRKQ